MEHSAPSAPSTQLTIKTYEGKTLTLSPDELAALYALMSKLSLATPRRRTRRYERAPHGARIDLRRTMRSSLRTGGEPLRLARRQRRKHADRLRALTRKHHCNRHGSLKKCAATAKRRGL